MGIDQLNLLALLSDPKVLEYDLIARLKSLYKILTKLIRIFVYDNSRIV